MIPDTLRLPTWLKQEWFRITYDPVSAGSTQFSVTIKNQKGFAENYHGQGSSVAHAAKEARKKREGK